MGEDNKTTHVFFHRDMDGLCCAFLVYDNLFRATPERNSKYKSVQYKEEINFSDVNKGDVVIFVDFTPSLEEAKRLFELKPYHIAILDHHPVEELHERLDLLVRGRDIGLTCGLNTNAKGAVEVVREWLRLPMLDQLTHRVGCRDVWDFAIGDTKAINEGIGALAPFPNCNNEEEVLAWFKRYGDLRNESEKVREIGECLLEKMDAEVKKTAKRARVWRITRIKKDGFDDNCTCLGVFANENISELGNYLAEQSEFKVAFVAVIDGGELRISFRSIDGAMHEARHWALSLGGGGHPKAAGCSFKTFSLHTSIGEPTIIVKEE
jgi:oligoribonuclease NrnB/cAMP/cGMP phosphodiesterase (DHH superfamily)